MDRLRELRNQKGFTQQQMADYLGVVQSAYHYYETGMNEPGMDILIKMAALLETSIDYLVGNTDYPGVVNLTESESSIIATYRSLPENIRGHIDNFVSDIKESL